jgi:beta-glucosidase
MRQVLSAILVLACMAGSSRAGISGRVVDGAGKGVYDAMICYTNPANRLIYAYADANGYFYLPAPTEWKLNDLPMYKPVPTSIKSMISSQHRYTSLSARVNGDLVLFTLGSANRRVTADLFDVTGKKIMRVFDKVVVESGNHAFSPFVNNNRVIAKQLYVVRLSDGTQTISLRLINTGANVTAGALKSSDQVVSLSASPELAKIQATNSIRAGKTGYVGKTVQISTNYNDNLGNITITALNIEARIDSLMALMNIDDKVGQLQQPTDGGDGNIINYKIGSYLKGEGNAQPMTTAIAQPRKIPLIVGNDWVHGGRHVYYPHEIGLGCTGDTLLVELAYRMNAMMCLTLQNNCTFGPCLDVHRSDKSGRVYEGFAETPELTSIFARAAVRGIQGTDLTSGYTMMATLKHWAAAGGTTGGKGNGNVTNTKNDMGITANIHFPPFLAGIKAGAASIMTGYQSVFGTPMAINTQLVSDTLKTKYGFDGFVITDWATAGGREIACINSGHDMCMTVEPKDFSGIIKTAVANKQISESRLNDAVRRVLRAKFRMGLFENPWPNSELKEYLSSNEYREVARALVRKSLVLMKNENKALPLSKTAKIHVVGEWADNLGYQCGGWSATGIDPPLTDNTNTYSGTNAKFEGWQGSNLAHSINGATTILQAIKSVQAGATYKSDAANIPADAAVIVCVIGETPYAEGDGDRTDITLSAAHQSLVQACAASGKPVVTILITGRPNALGSIPGNSKALVAAWLPGTEGKGVSDVLFGDYPFVGKLSHTWPASDSQDPINTGSMGDDVGAGGEPLFQYGQGLTY